MSNLRFHALFCLPVTALIASANSIRACRANSMKMSYGAVGRAEIAMLKSLSTNGIRDVI